MRKLQILKHQFNGTHLITLKGEIDLRYADRVGAAIAEAPDCGTVKVDATGVSFIDSTGLRALLEGARHVGRKRFHLVPGPRTRRRLELTGLEYQFILVDE